MPELSTLGLFVAACLAFLVIPGPATVYVVTRSVDQGRTAGLVSVLGVASGALGHVLFAAVGLSAIVATSAVAFSVVKWLGVAYLVYLGIQRILSRDEEEAVAVEPRRLGRMFSQGVIVNLLNPKTALFFLAFLPQFVEPSSGPVWTQVLVLGVTLTTLGVLTDGIYALLGGAVGRWLGRRGAAFKRGQRYAVGGIYIALGAAAAVWRRAA